jgi:tetratricopeptide (TPR) repeat protein
MTPQVAAKTTGAEYYLCSEVEQAHLMLWSDSPNFVVMEAEKADDDLYYPKRPGGLRDGTVVSEGTMQTVETRGVPPRQQSTEQLGAAVSVETGFEQARSLHAQGKLDQAEQLYRAVLQADRTHIGSLHNLGILCLQRGQYDDTIPLTREVVRLRPDLPVAHLTLAVALRHLGRLEEAEMCCREALRLAPNYAKAHNTLGAVLTALRRWKEAGACCREALRLQPEYAEAHNNLGTALTALGRLDEAELCCREALRLKPRSAAAHNTLGGVLTALRRWKEAEACYREALRLQPEYAVADNNLGTALTALGRLDEAQRPQMNPDPLCYSMGGVELIYLPVRKQFVPIDDLDKFLSGFDVSGWVPEAVSALTKGLPIPPKIGKFQVNSFYRLPKHLRSCCISLANLQGRVTGPVIVLKGLEVLSPDLARFLQVLSRSLSTEHRLKFIEHFPLIEQKAPSALTLDEAFKEAEIALTIHRRLGRPISDVRLPLPIAIYEVGDEISARYSELTKLYTSHENAKAIERICQCGLGVYVYLYPSVPLRLFNTEDREVEPTITAHLEALGGSTKAFSTIDSWCVHAALLLSLNILPTTPLSRFRGSCLDINNVVLDGGFVDVGSCVIIGTDISDEFIIESLERSIHILSRSILRYICRGNLLSDTSLAPVSLIARYCFERLKSRLIANAQEGMQIDRRVLDYFALDLDAAALFDRLTPFVAAPGVND